jgi:hypothetical protein
MPYTKLTQEEIHQAFVDYPYARALLVELAVASEYIADGSEDESLPPQRELAQALQDIAVIACAVTNQDEYKGPHIDLRRPRVCMECGCKLGNKGDSAYQCYSCQCKLAGMTLCVKCCGLMQEIDEKVEEDGMCCWCSTNSK